MYTLELAWFELDMPDTVTVQADVSAPSPLFSNTRIGTQWRFNLGRFVMTAALDPVQGLQDLSRRAHDDGVAAEAIASNSVPGIRVGGYEGGRTQIDWWFSLNGLTLALSLRAKSGGQIPPTDAERRDHTQIIGSVRRLSRTA